MLFVVALVAATLALGVLPVASGAGLAPVYGFRTTDGHFVLPYAAGLIETNPVTPGSTVFGDVLYLEVTPNGENSTVVVSSDQSGSPAIWYNQSFSVDAFNVSTLTFTLPSSTVQRDTKLCVNGGCISFEHLTPISLIPSGVLNVGGLDLVVFSSVLEFSILIVPLAVLARWLCRKALWTPRFRIELLVPHLIAFVVIGTAVDFEAFDQFFGGYAFILYAPIFAVSIFFWLLHLFNTAKPVEVLRPDPQGGHRLRFNRWRIWVADLPDGRKVLVGTKWRDWLARLFGHFPVLVPSDIDAMKVGPPAESPLVTWRADVRGERPDKRLEAFRSRPRRETPLDDFKLATNLDYKEKDAPVLLYWVDSDRWLDYRMPYLSWHREVMVPAKVASDGTVLTPAHTKMKLSGPHYVDVEPQASLAGIHYYDAPAAALGWIAPERSYRRVEDLRLGQNALRVASFLIGDESAEVRSSEIFRLLARDRTPLSDTEAADDVRREPPASRPGDTSQGPPDRPKPKGSGA